MDVAYVINLGEYKSIGTYWIAFYLNGDNGTNIFSFKVGNIPKEIEKLKSNKNIDFELR